MEPCYLEAVGGGQAALFPEAEGALQLLCGAQGERVGPAQAAQQGQAGREARQVVAAWDTGKKGGWGWVTCSLSLPCSSPTPTGSACV